MTCSIQYNYARVIKLKKTSQTYFGSDFQCYFLISLLALVFLLLTLETKAQLNNDTINESQDWNIHFQNTVIMQYHPSFHASYSGMNSLKPVEETPTSVTSTLFMGAKIWNGAEVYFNPEISGGAGFSQTTGIAGFPNGEVYRVSDQAPHIYVARLYIRQTFALSDSYKYVKDDINQIAKKLPTSYFAVSAGKFSVMDFFDNNKYSHDPRTQFYNWTLMGNGAWDYPANTRGYTYGLTFELVKPEWALRFGVVTVPTTANGSVMDTKIAKSRAESLEFEQDYSIGGQKGVIRLIGFLTEAQMGNYKQAIDWGLTHNTTSDLAYTRGYGKTKYGMGINIEHNFNDHVGMFFRSGWNDGHNETWAFTEIDRHASIGLSLNGNLWNRKEDNLGIASITNGISKDHRDFLADGGYGFIIGDGKLNYGLENITELYYSFRVSKQSLWLSPDYQFIINPAYNKDRGPVHAFGIRFHAEI